MMAPGGLHMLATIGAPSMNREAKLCVSAVHARIAAALGAILSEVER
jgi:hypothetical protein